MLQHIHIYIHVTLGQWTVQWYTSSDNQIYHILSKMIVKFQIMQKQFEL